MINSTQRKSKHKFAARDLKTITWAGWPERTTIWERGINSTSTTVRLIVSIQGRIDLGSFSNAWSAKNWRQAGYQTCKSTSGRISERSLISASAVVWASVRTRFADSTKEQISALSEVALERTSFFLLKKSHNVLVLSNLLSLQKPPLWKVSC